MGGLRARLVRGLSWNLVGTAFNQGSTFVVNIILANLWGISSFGEYALVLSMVSAVVSVSQLATGYTATRYVAQYRTADPPRAARLLGLCALVSTVMGGIASAVLLAVSPWLAGTLGHPHLAPALMIAALVVLPSVMNGFIMGALAGLEAYPSLGKAGVVSGLTYLVAATTGGWIAGVHGAFAGVALSACIQMLLLRRALIAEASRHHLALRLSGVQLERGALVKFAIPAALNGFLYLPAIWLTNAWLAGRANGLDAMALFAAANSFRVITLFVPSIMNNVAMSLLNNQRGADDERRYRRVFWTNLAVTAALAVSGALAMALTGPWLLALFGRDFGAGYPVLLTLLLAAVLETMALSTLHPIQSQDRVWIVFFLAILPCYLTLVLVAAALIPSMGALGVAWGYVSGWGVATVASVCLLAKHGLWQRPLGPEPVNA